MSVQTRNIFYIVLQKNNHSFSIFFSPSIITKLRQRCVPFLLSSTTRTLITEIKNQIPWRSNLDHTKGVLYQVCLSVSCYLGVCALVSMRTLEILCLEWSWLLALHHTPGRALDSSRLGALDPYEDCSHTMMERLIELGRLAGCMGMRGHGHGYRIRTRAGRERYTYTRFLHV